MKIIITGGAGFIGSAVIRYIINETSHKVINIDKLTYAGNLESLASIKDSSNYSFEKIDICEHNQLKAVFEKYQPDAVMHLAAESHVDRSITGPSDFIKTNILGTYTLLEAVRQFWVNLDQQKKEKFRFHHVSTDEVYGDLKLNDSLFTETTPYAPSSPYSASKASSDHLVRAWGRTYGLPVIISSCSNNYGPHQFPEKLIPLVILNAIEGKSLPIYGDGTQIRDWLYVEDHAKALLRVIEKGEVGNTYNIGGHNELRNIDVVHAICDVLDNIGIPKPKKVDKFSELITFVKDRPGHDLRYAIDAKKIDKELGWTPGETFESGIKKTVEWYLSNEKWCQNVLNGNYSHERLGLLETEV